MRVLYLIITLILYTACSQPSEYEKLVDRELKEGPTIDSLFMGYYFGMPQNQFYNHSWELNKQKLVRHGTGNNTIRKEVKSLKNPAAMNFYPGFDDGEIHQMRVVFNYKGWAPWNKDLWADSLKIDVINYYENKLDVDFQEITGPDGKKRTMNITGNREMEISTDGTEAVVVMFRDLRYESNLNRFKRKNS